jgi:uncharacterized cupredoxin-like copper-binding protein
VQDDAELTPRLHSDGRDASSWLAPEGSTEMLKSIKAVSVAALLPTTFLAAARPIASATPKRPSAQVVTVTAVDYGFEAPASISAGTVTLNLVNRGKELHHLWLAKLEDGHTVEDLQKLPPGKPPAWFKNIGGPNAPAPGGAAQATVTLEPGNYVLLCFIPSADGMPHFMKGMMKPLTVTGTTVSSVEPKADVTMRLVDYGFDIKGALTAGKHVIRVENAAEQPHEVFVAKLAPGKSAMDLVQWAEKPLGQPPGLPIGGATGVEKGRHLLLSVNLEPGKYALVCFVPDANDGKPHVAHGMVREITVDERVAIR